MDGCERSFDRLALRYQDRLYRFLLVRSASSNDIEDVMQETWLSVHRYLHTYQSTWAFSTWLYRIAMRAATRFRWRIPAVWIDQDATPTPLESYLVEEGRGNLWQLAQKHLNPAQVSALWLFYAEDRPQTEIAYILGKSESWVKVNLHRARHALKQKVEEDVACMTLIDN